MPFQRSCTRKAINLCPLESSHIPYTDETTNNIQLQKSQTGYFLNEYGCALSLLGPGNITTWHLKQCQKSELTATIFSLTDAKLKATQLLRLYCITVMSLCSHSASSHPLECYLVTAYGLHISVNQGPTWPILKDECMWQMRVWATHFAQSSKMGEKKQVTGYLSSALDLSTEWAIF